MKELRLLSNAKINLSLKVLGIREDKFHEIDSVMQSVSLTDEINISQKDFGIEIICDQKDVPLGSENTVHRAANAFLILQRAVAEPRSS